MQIFDINGYIDTSYSHRFNNALWSGKIVLRDDHYFEGIVEDGIPYKDKCIIFGIIHPNKIIELIYFSVFRFGFKDVVVKNNIPFIYEGIMKNDNYDGLLNIIDLNGIKRCGLSRVNLKELQIDDDNKDVIIKDLNDEFNLLLKTLNEDCLSFYEGYRCDTNVLSDNILNKYKYGKSQFELKLEKIDEMIDKNKSRRKK